MTNDIINHPALKQFQSAPYRKIELDPSAPSPLFPSMCCETPGGDILIIDDLGHAAFLFAPSGKLIRRIGGRGSDPGQFNHPSAAAIVPDGRIFITDCWNHRVQIFTPELDFISTFGSPGSAPGQLLEPSGAAILNGNIVISEIENRRLSIFDQSGNFITTLRSLSGLEAPLSYITSVAVVGRYLAALTASETILILDENLICENIINLGKTAGPPMNIYAAGADAFFIASYTGGITYYALEGSVLRADNSVISGPYNYNATDNEACGVYAAVADLGSKRFSIVAAPSFKSPLYKLLDCNSAAGNEALLSPNIFFISEVSDGGRCMDAARAAEFNKAEPGKFRASLLKALLSKTDNIESARDTAVNIIKRTPAISAFQSIAAAAPDPHILVREYSKNNSAALIEQIEVEAPGCEGKRPLAYDMRKDGEFIVYLFPGALLSVDKNKTAVITPNETDPVYMLTLAYDGSYAACTHQNELIHLAPDGKLIRKLTRQISPTSGVWRQSSIPRTKDGRAFVWPNLATGSLDTFDFFCPAPEKPVDSVAPPSGVIIDTSFSATGDEKYALTSEHAILTIDNSNNIIASREIPTIALYTPMFIATLTDGDILASYYMITPGGHLEGYPLMLVKICAATFEPLFFMDSFSTKIYGAHNVVYPKFAMQPIPAPDNCFWLMDRVEWKIYKFKIGSA